jgi:hypothetical protein
MVSGQRYHMPQECVIDQYGAMMDDDFEKKK